MKGPLAGNDNNFTLGWNMKFKKGHVNKATFRVEYPLDLYQVNNEMSSKDIGNGMVRIEKHFRDVSPKTDMQLDLEGIVKSSTVELVPPSDPTTGIIITLGVLLIIPTIAFFSSNRKQKAEGTSTDSTNDSTANSYDYSNSYDYYSDGGASCGSCGCDAD